MVKSWAAANLLVAMVLAGCAGGDPDADAAEPLPDAFDDIVVTSTTGAIRGIVVSEAIVPIPGATVELTGTDKVQTTSDEGAFVFSGLEPRSYFLQVSKPGYFATQASTDVVAGLEQPPIVKVQLVIDAANQPFTELLSWTGFLGCGAGTNGAGGPVAGSVNPCAVDALACDFVGVCLLNTANTNEFPIGGGRVPDWAQAEMVWEGTQPLGNYLNLGWYDEGVSDFKGASGPPPVIVAASYDEIVDAHDENITSLLARVFPGSNQELTLTLQQRFDVFVTYFYGFAPREGWTFVVDGPCVSPEDCGA